MDAAADAANTLLQAGEPEAARTVDAAAVIDDIEDDSILERAEGDHGLVGVGVLHDIGQPFARGAQDDVGKLGGYVSAAGELELKIGTQPEPFGLGLELIHECAQFLIDGGGRGRELEILQALATGASNKQIAQRLFISEATVKTHLIHVYQKLGVETRTAAVSAARERKLIQ